MSSSNNKRIAKNTLLLYFRMILNMTVSLYTSRIILNTLGVEDYGIYNVVGGVVMFIAVLNNSMSSSTSRFLIFELGRKDKIQLNKVFNAALAMHVGIALIVLVLAETAGLWVVMHKLVIPDERMSAALWAFHFSVAATMVSLTQVPYNAMIIAHERMNIYAYISLFNVFLKLIIVYLLTIGDFDKLKLYSLLMFIVSVVTALAYRFYCIRKFDETTISFSWDKDLYKKMFVFSGWALYSNIGASASVQGVNVLLNMFFGPAVNAARAIAVSVQTQISAFGDNFMIAVKPQIVKLYAENKTTQMMKLVFMASRYSFFLIFFISLPALLETKFVLTIWLKTVPDYTISFCRLVLVYNFITSLMSSVAMAFHAVGKLKAVSLVSGSLCYLSVMISFIFLKLGYAPTSVFVVTVAVRFVMQMLELFLLKKSVDYSIKSYMKEVIMPVISVVFLSGTLPFLISITLESGLIRFLLVGFTSVITVSISVYFIGLDRNTKEFVVRKIRMTTKIFKRKKS